MQLGKLIKYHRTRQDITQKELASGICSVSYLSKIENNSITPKDDVIIALAERLHISLNFVQDGEIDIKEQIMNWYELIKKRKKKDAEEEYYIIKQKCENSSTNLETKHLFAVMTLLYELTFISYEYSVNTYMKLREIQHFLNDETLYYFLKFESIYLYYKNDINGAIHSLEQAENIFPDSSDLSLFYNLAFYYKKTYQMYKSILYANKLLKKAQRAIDYDMMTYGEILIASNYIRIGEYDEGNKILAKLKESEYISDPSLNSIIYHNLGYISLQKQEYQDAILYFEKSIESEKTDSVKLDTIYFLTVVYRKINDKLNLEKYLEMGKVIAKNNQIKKYNYKFYVLETRINKTTLTDSFIKNLSNEIIPFFEKTGERNELMQHLKLLGNIYYQTRQYKKSSECFSRIHDMYINTFRIEDFI